MTRNTNIIKIVSGGQTGVDRAALDIALRLGYTVGGWCPKNRMAEDGIIDSQYPLIETPLEDVDQRTEWNVRDSNGTLILSIGTPIDGTPWTADCTKKYNKPLMYLDLESSPNIQQFNSWLKEHHVKTLNIAGPRESHQPGLIYTKAIRLLEALLA